MKGRVRITGKILLIIVCTLFLIFLIHKDETVFQLKQPQGEGIEIEDVLILVRALTGSNTDFTESARINSGNGYLDYGSYLTLLDMLEVTQRETLLYDKKYRDSFYLLKEDWYQAYDEIVKIRGMEDDIVCREISVLTEEIMNNDEEVMGILTADGKVYPYDSPAFSRCRFQTVKAYVTNDRLLTLKSVTKEKFTLENVWIMEKEKESLQIFINGFEVVCPWSEADLEVERESIADITFGEGRITDIKSKQERISGKLLRISNTELEIEGKGTFPVHENCKVYRLYDKLCEQKLLNLQLGYDFADYVIDDGKVCSVLIMRKEDMESIRVAIKTNEFASLYHKEIKLKPDCDMELTYGPYHERQTKTIRAGEEISFERDSAYLSGDMIYLKPLALSGKTEVLSLMRNQGIPAYRGNLQIAQTAEGLTLINEVLLEEYLYSVVPSEMPASYPQEALKAQAICARTYAYRYLEAPGLGEIGAHVDDSVGYQVYNNIAENVNSTKAVKETAGKLLYYGEKPVHTYYYSTSCGFGTDVGVWQAENTSDYPYLTALHINRQSDGEGDIGKTEYTGHMMQEEKMIREYLFSVNEKDYESKEPWYRWSYFVEEIETSVIYERLYSRFRADHTKVLKKIKDKIGDEGTGYQSVTPTEFKAIYNIECIKRRDGGVMDELILETDSGTYKVISEYNIRYLLNQGGEVLRQDGSTVSCGQILPSAYIVIDLKKDEGAVSGYHIIGGGYGHGVGLSQNGARSMAKEGRNCEEIITYFYSGGELRQIY